MNSSAPIRLVVKGESGNVKVMTVLDFRAVMKSVRPGRMDVDGTPFRSAMRTFIPRAFPMVATRLPVGGLDGLRKEKVEDVM